MPKDEDVLQLVSVSITFLLFSAFSFQLDCLRCKITVSGIKMVIGAYRRGGRFQAAKGHFTEGVKSKLLYKAVKITNQGLDVAVT